MQTTHADINNIVEPDGVIGEHVAFIKQHEDIDHALKVVPSCQLPILDYTAQVSTCGPAHTYWN